MNYYNVFMISVSGEKNPLNSFKVQLLKKNRKNLQTTFK